MSFLEKKAREEQVSTQEPENPLLFSQTHNVIIGSNLIALDAARAKGEELGYHTLILSSSVQGETREVARVYAAIAREILTSGNPIPRPACVISGDETTVTIKGEGSGAEIRSLRWQQLSISRV